MTLCEQVNDICGKTLCSSVKKSRITGKCIFIGAGRCRTITMYNKLCGAVRTLGGGVVRWNDQEREVEA